MHPQPMQIKRSENIYLMFWTKKFKIVEAAIQVMKISKEMENM